MIAAGRDDEYTHEKYFNLGARTSASWTPANSGLPDQADWFAYQHDPCDLPVSTLQSLPASRDCEVDSKLTQFAWNRFGSTPMGWGRVQAVCDFVHDHLRFDYKLARLTRTLLDGIWERTGVSDFTHLAITLCR